jgi:ATP-dependent RNA helicase SUPV3L1/SUV3
MDKRPPLPVVVEAPIVAEAANAETPAVETDAVVTDAAPESSSEVSSSAASLLPPVDFAPSVQPEVVETAAPDMTATEVAAPEVTVSEPSDAAASSDQPVADAATPELVEVWRPGGRNEERRPHHTRHRHRALEKNSAPVTEGQAHEGDEKRDPHGDRSGRHRHRRNDYHKPQGDAVANGEGAQARPQRDEKRPQREPFKGRDRDGDRSGPKSKFNRGGRDNRKDHRKDDRGGGALRTFATSASPAGRDRVADPNSPFAKLAALKEQLGRKDS